MIQPKKKAFALPIYSLVQSLKHLLFHGFFIVFVHCRIIVKIWNHVVTKKVLNKSKDICDFL